MFIIGPDFVFQCFLHDCRNACSRNFGFRVGNSLKPRSGTLSSGGQRRNNHFTHVIRWLLSWHARCSKGPQVIRHRPSSEVHSWIYRFRQRKPLRSMASWYRYRGILPAKLFAWRYRPSTKRSIESPLTTRQASGGTTSIVRSRSRAGLF
jgi:hypothetical protein